MDFYRQFRKKRLSLLPHAVTSSTRMELGFRAFLENLVNLFVFIFLNPKCCSLLASVLCNQAMNKGHIIALKRVAKHALPILPIPGSSFGPRLALPSLSGRMVYMTAPASCGFGRLAFSESACYSIIILIF